METVPKRFFKRAFTLIELMVVVSIIAILATVVVVAAEAARSNTRDKVRISDLEQAKTALRLYAERYGTFDAAGEGELSATMSVLVTEGLLPAGVSDPLGGRNSHPGYEIYFQSGGATVGACLFAAMETAKDIQVERMNDAPVSSATLQTATNNGMTYATCVN